MTTAENPNEPAPRDRQMQPAAERADLQRLIDLSATRTPSTNDEDVIDLREYWHVLVRRKGTVLTVLAVALLVALLATFLATPIYRATLLLQIEREQGKVLEYQDITPEESVNDKDFYQTQYELLKSESLAMRVIDQLGLRSAGSFATDEGSSWLGDTVGAIKGWIKGGASDADEEKEPDLEKIFLENLSVDPVKNSRLVHINYDSPDPQEAAEIANAIAKNFISMNLERRYDAASYAKTFLEGQTKQIRANLEDSERRLLEYAKAREIINPQNKLEILMQKLKEMSSELVKAESERILAEAEYQEMVKEGNASTSNVLDNPVIQQLKQRKAELESEYQEQLRVYKPGYPKMQQLQHQIGEIKSEVANESATIANSLKTNFEAKLQREAKLTIRIGEIKTEILALQDRTTDYQALKREVDTNRELYDGLLQRMKEIGVAAGVGTNNISVVDPAKVPQGQYKPSLKKNIAIAVAVGLFGGVLLAFLFETLDDTVKSSEEVERRIGAPVLGVVPLATGAEGPDLDDREVPLLAFKDPRSALAEAYRSLRTSLVFATSEGAPKIMHFTSASEGEGKTTSAVNTAITFAQTGSKVLLIDTDLRNSSLHHVFVLPNTTGLTNYLAGDTKPIEIAQPTAVTRLFTITSGPLPPNPVELLSGAKMLDLLSVAGERFDYVILDGPPVLGLADALVLANLATATLFVVEPGSTRAGALEASIKRLRAANAVILGAVLAKVGKAGTGYGYGYGYDYHYSYTYGSQGDQDALPEHATT